MSFADSVALRGQLRLALLNLASAYPIAVAVLLAATWLPLPESGPLGLAQLLSVHLSLGATALTPLLILPGRRRLAAALGVLLVVFGLRFGGEWWSLPPATAAGPSLAVMTWNLEAGSRPPADSVSFLHAHSADLVMLQELTTGTAAAIDADPVLRERYPYRELRGRDDVLGLGVLSRAPLADADFQVLATRLEATTTTPGGPVRLIDVHPMPGGIARGPLGLPSGFDGSTRDAELGQLRIAIDGALAGPAPVLVAGDINTSPAEPAFGRFTRGLFDAHAEVGLGPGWTWRPHAFESLGIGLLRIDVVLSGPQLRPVSVGTLCPPVGDHCAVRATLTFGRQSSAIDSPEAAP